MLQADVDVRGWVVADEHRGKPDLAERATSSATCSYSLCERPAGHIIAAIAPTYVTLG